MPDMPKFDQLLYPLLRLMADGEAHAISDLRPLLADDIGLSQDQRGAVSGSGNNVFGARVSWTQTGLLHAGLIERVSSGVYRITQAGREFLELHQAGFALADIRTLAPYVQWRSQWGQGGHVSTDDKPAVFEGLYAEFLKDFPDTEEGRRIAELYTTARVAAQANYEKALATPKSSRDFVDTVMWGLLPYRGTPNQIAQGAWVHWAPSTIGGTFREFYAKQWTTDDDWNRAADNLLAFVRGCVEDPSQLAALAGTFSASPYGKGFQQGMVTPALSALRPDDFYLGNSKTSSTVNYFAGTKHSTALTGYRDFNKTIHKLVDELTPVLETGPDSVSLIQDRFDMFCHWLVAVKQFDFTRLVEPPKPQVLAQPFATIFADYGEAEWAFGLLAQMADRLGLTGPDDPRFACTLRYRGRAIHFNFCNWLLAGFYAPGFRDDRVALTIGRDMEGFGDLSAATGFIVRGDEPGAAFAYPPIEQARAMSAAQQASLDESLDYFADRFSAYTRSPYRKAHEADFGRAIFDAEFRAQLLTGTATRDVRKDYSLAEMAEETGFAETELRAWVSAIQRKKQAILYGPPGTGKTYVARRLAQYLVANDEAKDGFFELVQFHPAYAYEDFIQGIRPQADEDGDLSYELEPGRFLDFIEKARGREGTCVLIVDEINRANLARVFGELMYLLEYREDEIALASGGTLRIPANVRLIGTMNTADRSIALVDHALRRRFAFLELQPKYAVLRRFHAELETDFPVEALVGVLGKVNGQIRNPHYFVGISFFLDKELNDTIESVWRTEIHPYLDEYFFDQPKVLELFTWEAVRPQLGL